MAINFSKQAPSDGLERVTTHLNEQTEVATKQGMRTMSAERTVNASPGIQIWTLAVEDIGQAGFDAATAGEWRYFIFESDEVVSEVQLSGEAGATGVTATGHGPLTEGVIEALSASEAIPQVTEGQFEPRLILIPSIVFAALWLHNDVGDDVFVPIPPTEFLENYKPFSSETVIEALRTESDILNAKIIDAPGPSGGNGGGNTGGGKASLPLTMTINQLNLAPLQAPTGGAANSLPQFMQYQQQTNWCWSAVGTSVGLLFQTGQWIQCDTATGCLPGQNCCSNSGPCNVYGYLDKSLRYTQSFDRMTPSKVTQAAIVTEINSGEPLCTRVAWFGGGAHFMAVTGYNGNSITIQDSIFGTSTIAYNSYPSRYQTGGSWTHSYYCKK